MSTPINRLPLGLLGLVDSKTLGVNPGRLEESVRCGIDFVPFMLAQGRQKFTGTGSITAVGPMYSNLVVPQTQMWICESIAVIPNVLGAGQQVHGKAIASDSATQQRVQFEGDDIGPGVSWIQNQSPRYRLMEPGETVILLPGSVIGFWCSLLAAGPLGFNAEVVATPVRI